MPSPSKRRARSRPATRPAFRGRIRVLRRSGCSGSETPLTAAGEGIRELAASIGPGTDIDRLHRLMAIDRASAWPIRSGATDAATTAEEALTPRTGVCQDHAHIFAAAARAARLSGPLCQRLSDDGRDGRPGGEPCLGRSACFGPRLGRLRCRQRYFARRALCARGDGPRLSRRHAGVGDPAWTGAKNSLPSRSRWSSNSAR